MNPLSSKLKLLYLDYSKSKIVHESKIAEFQSKLDAQEAQRQAAETKSDRLELLVKALAGDSNQIKQELVDGQRRLIVLEVNEQALMRRYTASTRVEQVYQKEIVRLKVMLKVK